MTSSTPDGATLLGVVDDYEYLAVEWVYRRQIGGGALAIDYYCTRAAWPATPAAQLAARDQIITDLRAQVAEQDARLADLERQLAAVAVPPAVAQAATGRRRDATDPVLVTCPHCERRCASPRGLATHIRLTHDAINDTPVECPKCTRTSKNAAGLTVHRPNCPAAGVAIVPIASEEEPPAPRIEPAEHLDGWRCARCASDTFAPGLHDITICMRCEGTAKSTNGSTYRTP